MQLGGKLTHRGFLTVTPVRLVHVLDQLSNRRFLLDTGASYSIFPHSSSSPPTGPLLAGPSGTSISCWGEKEFSLSFSGRLFKWTLLLADVKFPILGVDFLRHHRLLVDPAEKQLITTAGSASTSAPPSQLSPMVSPVIAVPGPPAASAAAPPVPTTFAQPSAATSSGSSSL